jgi:pantothenate kinase
MATLTSVDAVADLIRREAPTTVGIAGSPGAGKSTLAGHLVHLLPSAVLLPMDGFHLPQARLVELGRRDRMGAPDTFDVDALLATLDGLESGTVLAPDFDRDIEEPVPDVIRIEPARRPVVLEGNYLLLWEEVRRRIDLTFFLEADAEIRRSRLIERHIRFGKAPEAARAWALGTDEANAVVIEATAPLADHRIRLG